MSLFEMGVYTVGASFAVPVIFMVTMGILRRKAFRFVNRHEYSQPGAI